MEAGEGDEVKAAVHGVSRANDADVADDSGWEVELLPRPAEVLGAVHHCHPVLLVQRDLDVVRVGPSVEGRGRGGGGGGGH